MSSIAEYRRVIEIEARVQRLEATIAEMGTALDRVMTLYTELEVRLDTPPRSHHAQMPRRA